MFDSALFRDLDAMKRMLAGLLSAFSVSASAAAEDDAVWSTAVATRSSDGHRIIYRYRSEFDSRFKRSKYPDRIIISWKYDSPDGMPPKAQHDSMDRLEHSLAPFVERPNVATLVIVSTGEGIREWIYYATSNDKFMSKLNEALHGQPRLPIEIDLWTEPTWERYEQIRNGVLK